MIKKDWVNVELSQIAKLYQPKTISKNKMVEGGKYDVYGANGIIGKYDQYNHEESELLITCRGATCGNVHISNPFSWINGNAMVVKPLDSRLVTIDYLKTFFSNKNNLSKSISGSAQPQITRTSLNPVKIPLIPVPEQKAIVSKIEELFSSLDSGIADLKKAQEQLKLYRQAVLIKAFEGKDFNEEPEFISLGSVIEKPKYGTSKKCSKEKKGIPVLRIPNIGSGKINSEELKYAPFEADEIEKLALEAGDILTIRSNGSVDLVGKCALITENDSHYLYAGYLIRLRPLKSEIVSKYLLHCLSSHQLRLQIESKAKSTSGVNNINSGELQSLEIPYFKKSTQKKIVQYIENQLTIYSKIEESIEISLNKSHALRQSILKRAFEGKLLTEKEIEKCKQAVDYEPASKLLERIKTQQN